MRFLSAPRALALVACLLPGLACAGDGASPPPTSRADAPPESKATVSPAATPLLPGAGAGFTRGPQDEGLKELSGLVWQRGGALLAYSRSEVRLVDLAAGTASKPLKVETGEAIVSAADTGFVAIMQGDSVTVRNPRLESAPKRITPRAPASTAVLSSDGSLLALPEVDRITVELWDLEEQRQLKQLSGFEAAAPVYGVRFGPGGRTLVWVSRAKVQLQDLASGALGPAFQHEDPVAAVALTTDRSTLVTASGAKLTVWDVASGQGRTALALTAPVAALGLAPDNRTLAIATSQGVRLWDVQTAKELGTLQGNARLLAFSEDGKQLAAGEESGAITIWRRP